ncbi:MAG: hypothetical protein AAB849_01680 [Patescibacteria group bacterium]
MKKFLRWALIYLLLVIGLFLILVGVNWYLIKQREVRLGLARPAFPYAKYSQEELDKMYPQYPNENVATRVTPEQTYAKLIAALKVGDLDEASKQFVAGQQSEWLESLKKIKEKGLLGAMIVDLDKELGKNMMSGAMAQFMISIDKDGEKWARPVDFVKDSNGDWKIKSL